MASRPPRARGSRFTVINVPPGFRMRRISPSVLVGSVKWITRPTKAVSKASGGNVVAWQSSA